MMGSAGDSLAPLFLFLLIIATDLWVYWDAKAQSDRETPVYFRIGAFQISTPPAWAICCLFLWIIFFPVYLLARSSTP